MECINHKSIYSDNLNTINQQRHENLKSIESVFNRIEERQKVLNDLSSLLNHEAFIRLMSMRYSKQ